MRQAALKAGIGVIQFVHEPVAALHGYLRAQPDYRRVLDRLEGRSVLVFDWGGGTLDVTLCRIQGGSIMQIGSLIRFGFVNKGTMAPNVVVGSLERSEPIKAPGMAADRVYVLERARIVWEGGPSRFGMEAGAQYL